MDETDVVIAGAGVVGLAIARALARRGREVLILEAADAFGTGTSSRNSEVIHAGIYYPQGSLKARLCVTGRDLLYAYCQEHGVPFRRCGKLIVATTEAQLADLDKIRAAAHANGVALNLLPGPEARAMEPELRCSGALLSPETGIIDSHAYMLSLLGEAEQHGATLVCNSPVIAARVEPDGITITTGDPTEATGPSGSGTSAGSGRADVAPAMPGTEARAPATSMRLRARLFINAAGLHAPHLARRIEGFPAAHIPAAYFAKGNYFTLAGRSPFSRLVYPIPEPGGLGVHLTLDLAGRARFGPDVQWVDTCNDYTVDPARSTRFYGAIRQYWPALADGALQPAYCGIRPKISAPGEPNADFRIDTAATHGIPSVINLFGIESPGLTASLAIADHVATHARS
jgi:L-2-hydroxyglutarate oxidase LhgO